MATSPPIPFASTSLQLTSTPKLSHIYTPIHSSTRRSYPISTIRMCGISALPGKKPGPKKTRRKIMPSPSSEAEELVRSIVRNISDKQPLLNTLNKHVQFLRTEHCFLLFEELGRSERWLQCLEVFRWMQKQRWYVADNGVYSKLISVMGKKGQSRMAMWLFSEMRNSGCKPDTSVYNALITAHLHSREMEMKGMERCKPSVITYNILLRAFAQSKNVEQVNVLFNDLDESIISPDAFTFNGVMDAYGKVGLIREMELVLAKMKSKKIKPDIITFNLLIDAYGRKQEFEKMEQVFASLLRSKEKPTLPTFNSMITNYGKARLREKADLTYKKMIDMGYKPSFITYECLIMMYGYCDRVSRAREIFDEMIENGREKKVSTLNAMLDVYCMNGLPLEADKLFESARASQMLPVNSTTYKLLYKAYTKADMKEMVEKLLTSMDKDGIVPNKRFFLDALGALGSSSASKKSTSRKEVVPRKAAAEKA